MLIFLFLFLTSFQTLRASEAHMELVARFSPTVDEELIVTEKLEVSDDAIKDKSFTKNKYYKTGHVKYLSIFHASKKPQEKYLVSFYFHGTPEEFAVKISPVDLRKYFQKKIFIGENKNQCLKLIQAHFEEYNRKSRVFYPTKEKLTFETHDEFLEMAKGAKRSLNLKKFPSSSFVITNNCRGIGNYEYEWPGLLKGHFFIPPKFLDLIMGEYDSVKLSGLPDNLPLTHVNSSTELRTTKFYADQIDLNNWYGIKNKFVQWHSAYKDPSYQWYDLGNFEDVTENCPVQFVEDSLVKKDTNVKVVNLTVNYTSGKIPYEEFTAETRMKSGSVYMQESLAFIKTPCDSSNKEKVAPNFFAPNSEGNINNEDYWEKNKCAIIPHFFANYEDILNYPVHLSKFEVNGVYVGRSRDENEPQITTFDKSLQKDESKRVPYEFSKFAGNYRTASIERSNDYLVIKLLNKNKNIIIGNISLKKLHQEEKKPLIVSSFDKIDLFESTVLGISSLFGINPLPLVEDYNSSFNPDFLDKNPSQFALFYDDGGNILNHHLPSIGIEQWYVRKRGCDLIIDLISHERILPIARLKVNYFCQE